MVRADGYVKILDFGLAARMPASGSLQADSVVTTESTFCALTGDAGLDRRLSLPGQILGTIPYMSPEQIHGREVDQRSDLFAFGIILYEMLTGRHPWPRPSAVETLHAILHDEPPAVHAASLMHAELGAIVQKLLRKSPAERYQVADAVLEALGSRTASTPSSATSLAGATPLTSIDVRPIRRVDPRRRLDRAGLIESPAAASPLSWLQQEGSVFQDLSKRETGPAFSDWRQSATRRAASERNRANQKTPAGGGKVRAADRVRRKANTETRCRPRFAAIGSPA